MDIGVQPRQSEGINAAASIGVPIRLSGAAAIPYHLGRMATYSGKIARWDDAVAQGTSEFPKQLAWDAPAPVQKDSDGNYPIPLPGVYRAY